MFVTSPLITTLSGNHIEAATDTAILYPWADLIWILYPIHAFWSAREGMIRELTSYHPKLSYKPRVTCSGTTQRAIKLIRDTFLVS